MGNQKTDATVIDSEVTKGLEPCWCRTKTDGLSIQSHMDHGEFGCRERGRYVYCSNCWACGPTYTNDKKAIMGWNSSRRASVAAPPEDAGFYPAGDVYEATKEFWPTQAGEVSTAPVVEHDWQWYDRNLRATGYTDLANRMLAEFKPDRMPAAAPLAAPVGDGYAEGFDDAARVARVLNNVANSDATRWPITVAATPADNDAEGG